MSQLAMVNENIRRATKVLELGERIEQLLLNPNREVKVEVAIELDNARSRRSQRIASSTTAPEGQ